MFPHLLRHSYAVALLLGKADIRYVQELLGHADLDTTKLYLCLLPEHLRADYERAMPELLESSPLPGPPHGDLASHG